jgi:hypothetical protein
MKAQPAIELRRRGAAACLLAAPLLMLAGDALNYWAGAQRAWQVTFKFSFALFVGAALAVVRLTSGRADRTGLAGGALAVVGCLSGAGIVTANAIYGSINGAGLEEPAMHAVEAALRAGGVNGYILLYPLPGLAFPAGFLVLGLALWRARVVSPWAAGALFVGALLFPVGRIGGFAWAVMGSGVGMTVGLGLVARRVLGMSAGEWARLPAADAAAGAEAGRAAAAPGLGAEAAAG